MSALQRFFLRLFDRKAKQSVPRHTVRFMEMSNLVCPLYRDSTVALNLKKIFFAHSFTPPPKLSKAT